MAIGQVDQCTLQTNLAYEQLSVQQELTWKLLQLEEKQRDFLTDERAYDIAEFLSDSFTLSIKYYEEPRETFQRIISYGLKYNLNEEDFDSIVQDIPQQRYGNSYAFLSEFVALVFLRIAEQLHYQNIENGGIGPDFDLFVREMEDAVANEDIHIDWAGPADLIVNNDAIFYPNKRAIKLSSINADTVLYPLVNVVVHELKHAANFLHKIRQNLLKDEFSAYALGDKITVLLEEDYGIAGNFEISALREKENALEEQSWESLLRCQGLSEDIIDWWLTDHTMGSYSKNRWRDAIWRATYGMNNVDLQPIFEDYYRHTFSTQYLFHYAEDGLGSFVSFLSQIGQRASLELFTKAQNFEQLCCEREGIVQHSEDHGIAAFRCMSNIFFVEMMIVDTQPLSEKFLGENSVCFRNTLDIADFVVDGLLYYVGSARSGYPTL